MAHCSICNKDFINKGQLNLHINVNLAHGILEKKLQGLPLNCYQQSYLLDHYYESEVNTCREPYISARFRD